MKTAIIMKIAEVCRDVERAEGRDFDTPDESLEELLQACLGRDKVGEVSAVAFKSALEQIYRQNALVDNLFASSDGHHFNSEAFVEGRNLISAAVATAKANIQQENFQAAREALGRASHTLQDFYSHTNWVELGHKTPYANLLRPDSSIGPIAGEGEATCSDCDQDSCPSSILPSITREQKLTSGYLSVRSPFKPPGKCSHGGPSDKTSSQHPRGGIHKDEPGPQNRELYAAAVDVAIAATLDLLEDIRSAVGDARFLRLMGISRSSVLCFVIDTTGSMSDDIEEAKRVAFSIIDSKTGTQDEPSAYILVPFNDPEFGPAIRTTKPNVIKAEISKLSATGGGDIPEMCFSALKLALTSAPQSSSIFVFTDAPAKDTHLLATVKALIQSTRSTVSFFITNPGLSRRRRRDAQSGTVSQLYQDLAQASGGQAIVVSKKGLPQATAIIVDSTTSALVTLLQCVRSPGTTETFTFLADESVRDMMIYITGDSPMFTLHSPSGASQSSQVTHGPLGTIQSVGNLCRVRLNHQTGPWRIDMDSRKAYTLKVTGQSSTAFLYDFVEPFEGPHPGYMVIESRPRAGRGAKLLLTVTGKQGPDSLKVAEVSLVDASGSGEAKGIVEELGHGEYLVSMERMPQGQTVLLVKGLDKNTSSHFQRQSTTQLTVSQVTITKPTEKKHLKEPVAQETPTDRVLFPSSSQAQANSTLEPGVAFSLPFTVMASSTEGKCTIQANDDRGFVQSFTKRCDRGQPAAWAQLHCGNSVCLLCSPVLSCPVLSSLTLVDGSAQGLVTLEPPANTPSGTDITLTINAESPDNSDSNYVVLRLSVIAKVTADSCDRGNHTVASDTTKVTDFSPPVCHIVSVSANCSRNCSLSTWELSANITDGNGTGVQSVSLRRGDGILHSAGSVGEGGVNVTEVLYSASCCSPDVELIAVDAVGNVGMCSHSVRVATTTPLPPTTPRSGSPPLFPSLAVGLCAALLHLYQNGF
ncbi:von Willebrand factor A domain-containing protein 7-like [Scleropages formosus]|uniref:von Willebrand factor A domain-containing protein 7-like n=1 Tax=Scleropages formosus TaxID=113540 RepID=A0A0P7TKD2_SCLFO|nr:von Willebrand factor A domain-containing protein 7-like [Scleropages formosus]